MDYQSCVHALFSRNVTGGIKLGLNNMQRILQEIKNPEMQFKSIHVAGTNGKGSTVTKIASSLQNDGYKVGLYTSPHISCYRERITVNGEMISEVDVVSIASHLFSLVEKLQIPATFFELTTCIAFIYFAQKNVDFAVLETGLGGRLDATNVCHPIISVITSISLDHTKILGKTLDAITYEKGGIIKNLVPVVIGPSVPKEVIYKIAHETSSQVTEVNVKTSDFEDENRAVAKGALEILKRVIPLKDSSIEKGLLALPPCRYEQVPKKMLDKTLHQSFPRKIILDVAHNPDGVQKLFERLRKGEKNTWITCVFGISQEKDVDECLKKLLVEVNSIVFVQADSPRACPALELKVRAKDHGFEREIYSFDQIDDAMSFACMNAKNNDGILLVCGTFFIMRECRKYLGYKEVSDPIDLNETHLVMSKV